MEYLSHQFRYPSESSGLMRKSDLNYQSDDFSSQLSPMGGLDPYLSFNDFCTSFTSSNGSCLTPSRGGQSAEFQCDSLESSTRFPRYSMNYPYSSHVFDDSTFLSPPHDPLTSHPDSFLFESPFLGPSLASPPSHDVSMHSLNDPSITPPSRPKHTPPPLPPRSYLAVDSREAYSLVLPPSNRSSTSSITSPPSKPLSGLWSRAMPSVTSDSRDSSLMTAAAAPFTSARSPEVGEVAKEPESRPVEEKKRGAGEDVDIAKLRSGEETRSAVMIRNIPNRFSKDELCEILDGFVAGKYSIMNMPLDSKTHRNLGYCFIQFNTVEDLIVAYDCVRKDWAVEM